MDAKLQDLQARKEQAYNAGSPRSVERQHEKGKLLARERITTLLDRKINRGNIREFPDVVNRIAKAHGCETLDDIQKYEKEIVAAMRYRVDFLKVNDLGQPADPPADSKASNASRTSDSGRSNRSTASLPSRAAKPRSKR